MTPGEAKAFLALLREAPSGPRIEFGVFLGATLKLIADHPGETWGVDSFAGMAPSTHMDVKGRWDPYPEGRLSAPMSYARAAAPSAHLVKGFVPDVLAEINATEFSFAHLDMDQYEPTKHALEWVWPRMAAGGIVCFDDWFLDRDWLAAGAINEFVSEHELLLSSYGRKAWVIK